MMFLIPDFLTTQNGFTSTQLHSHSPVGEGPLVLLPSSPSILPLSEPLLTISHGPDGVVGAVVYMI